MKIITFWLTMHQIFFYQTCQLCRYKQCRLPASVPWQHGSSRPPVHSSFQVCYLGCYRLTPLRPTPWGHACLAASTWIIYTTSGILNSSADPWSAPVFEVPRSTSRACYHWMSFALGRGRVSWIGLKCRFHMLQSGNIVNVQVQAGKNLTIHFYSTGSRDMKSISYMCQMQYDADNATVITTDHWVRLLMNDTLHYTDIVDSQHSKEL